MSQFRRPNIMSLLPTPKQRQLIDEIRTSIRDDGREAIDTFFAKATEVFTSRDDYEPQHPGWERWGSTVLMLYREAIKTVAHTEDDGERGELKKHLDKKTEELAELMISEKPGPGHFWAGMLFYAKGEKTLSFDLFIEGAKASVENDRLRHSMDYAVNLFRFACEHRTQEVPRERRTDAATELTDLIQRKYGFAGNYWTAEIIRIRGGTSYELAEALAEGAVHAARNAEAELALANLEKIARFVGTKRHIDAHVKRLSGPIELKDFVRSELERSERLSGYVDVLRPLATDLEGIFDGYVARARDDAYRAMAYTYKARVKETVGEYREAVEFYRQAYAAIGPSPHEWLDGRANAMLNTVSREDPELANELRAHLFGKTPEDISPAS